MTDQLEKARDTLKLAAKEASHGRPHIGLIATRGLLRLREGDEKQGVALYDQAERLARELGDKELARRVRQKKHLELARFLIRKSAFERAKAEIKYGLAIHVKFFSYDEDLRRLEEDIGQAVEG